MTTCLTEFRQSLAKWAWVVGSVTTLGSALPAIAEAGASTISASAPTVVSLTKVGESRVSRTVFDYVFKVNVFSGTVPHQKVRATLTRVGKGTSIVDGEIMVGDLPADTAVTPNDTITLRQDRRFAFDSTALTWNVISQNSARSTVGADGGDLATGSGNVSIAIPPGALNLESQISISEPAAASVPIGVIGYTVMRFGPNGTTFASPVTIKVKIDLSALPNDANLSLLTLGYIADDKILEIPTTLDPVNLTLVGHTQHFSDYVVTWKASSKKPYGEKLGSFMGVDVRSNGSGGPAVSVGNVVFGYGTGLMWECVEFVNRFYLQTFGLKITEPSGSGTGNAKEYFRTATQRGLDRFPNDGAHGSPEVGDILVSEGSAGTAAEKYGHVAIVKAVESLNGKPTRIILVQQNFYHNAGDLNHPVPIANNVVQSISHSYPVVGWLRRPLTAIPKVSSPPICTAPIVGVPMMCSISGQNLPDSITFTASNCGPNPMTATAGGSSTRRSFICTPVTAGLAVNVTYTVPGFIGPLPSIASVIAASPSTFVAVKGEMSTARIGHTATRLADGRVLIAGGDNSGNTSPYLHTAEIFDPATGMFTVTGSMASGRGSHTATLLKTGKVLITGGFDQYATDHTLATAELYDPVTGTFASVGPMTAKRAWHVATLLDDGRVLIAGGFDNRVPVFGSYFGSAEIFDPTTGMFTSTLGQMTIPRIWFAQTKLSDGKVLLAGGSDGYGRWTGKAETFDPETLTFTPTAGAMQTARWIHNAALLSDGSVLLAGGNGYQGGEVRLKSVELYDPSSRSFSSTSNMDMKVARAGATSTVMSDGTVLIAGGGNGGSIYATAEVYDPATKRFSFTAGDMASARYGHSATMLLDGRVLLLGGTGTNGQLLKSAELYVGGQAN